MTSKTMRIAISLPQETFQAIEQQRHELRLRRSVAILEALRLWLKQKEKQKLEDQYVKGYRIKPERFGDIEPFYRAGLTSFTKEEW